MNTTPKLNFLPSENFGEGVWVDVVDMQKAGEKAFPFKASRIVISPGQWSPLDEHEVRECWFIAAGEGTLVYAGEVTEKVKTGDFLYYDSFKSHKILNESSGDLVIFSMWW